MLHRSSQPRKPLQTSSRVRLLCGLEALEAGFEIGAQIVDVLEPDVEA